MATPQLTPGIMGIEKSPEMANEWNFDTQALYEAAKETNLANPEWWVDMPRNREQIGAILGEPGISIVANAYWASREFNELHKTEIEKYNTLAKEVWDNRHDPNAMPRYKEAVSNDPVYQEWQKLSNRYDVLWLNLGGKDSRYDGHNIEIAIIYAKKANIIFSEEVKES